MISNKNLKGGSNSPSVIKKLFTLKNKRKNTLAYKIKPLTMKCPVCVKLGMKSTLQGGPGTVTAMYCPPYYDEDGNYHNHDNNTTTSGFKCSNGHSFVTEGHGACPSSPKHGDFQKTETIIVTEPKDFKL